ncbi:repeat protein [Moumouvirus goulette]|uniref:Repeat protein n=1 Tax=Moumouvirus goulette TaxID=1247379 RepID=M1PFR6_9VIRU|nr:repeat protein [Moumouvirus goulette]AGF84838.1 repeat protein [Moumouvirus goulette]
MLACAYSFGDNNLTLVKFLLKQGIDVNATDIFGRSALDFSLEKQGNIEIIKLLIKNIVDKSLLNEALLTWSKTHYLPDITVANILIKSGASINITDDNGNSLLINIINKQLHDDNFTNRYKNYFYETIVEITKFLLTNGIDTKIKSSFPGYSINLIIGRTIKNKCSLFEFIFHKDNKQSDNYPLLEPFYSFSQNLNSFLQDLDIYYPESYRMNKKQCYNKLTELFIVYGCEYTSFLKKFNNNHLEIIKTIEFSKKYFKTIKKELENIYTEIIYKPGGIRSNMFKLRWNYLNGLDYYDIKKSNQKLFNYFGIGDKKKLVQIINSI